MSSGQAFLYGRNQDTWERLIVEGERYLREQARLKRTVSYSDLNSTLNRRTAAPLFDFTLDGERAAMGHLLGEIVTRSYPELGAMLSSIVVYIDANDAGPGFYGLATQMGLLESGASRSTKEKFWIEQMKLVHANA